MLAKMYAAHFVEAFPKPEREERQVYCLSDRSVSAKLIWHQRS